MVIQFIFAFWCSIFFAVFLTFFFKRRGPGPFNGVLYFFAIIFSFTLALGIWMHPIGPMYHGLPWLAVGGTALLITLLIAELVPHKDKYHRNPTKEELLNDENEDEKVLKQEFSILIILICVILLAAYIYAFTHRLPEMTKGF